MKLYHETNYIINMHYENILYLILTQKNYAFMTQSKSVDSEVPS